MWRETLMPVDPSTGPRLPGIQGVRALAAVTILVSHAWHYSSPDGARVDLGLVSRYLFPHLALGVTLLFVLSAFLLYKPFAVAILRGAPHPRLWRYLRNRALRIFPAYWVILLATALVLQTALLRDRDGTFDRGALLDPLLLAVNGGLLQGFHPRTLLTGIGPAWALTVVVTFYASLPLLVLLARRLAARTSTPAGRRLAVLAPALVLLAVGLSGKAVAALAVPAGGWGSWGADWHSVIARSLWAHADAFALGLVVAVLRAEHEQGRLRLPARWRPAALAAAVVTAVATAKLTVEPLYAVDEHSVYVYSFVTAALCAVFLALVVLPGRAPERPTLLVRLLELRPVVTVGVVSYSLFLWHEPLVYWLNERGLTAAGQAGFALNVGVLFALSFLLSALSFRFVERPALLRKPRLTPGPEAATPPSRVPAR